MLAIQTPSHLSMAGHRRHFDFNPSYYPQSQWSPTDTSPVSPYNRSTFEHYSQNYNLAYRPRLDGLQYPGPYQSMASPPNAMDTTPQPQLADVGTHEYPDDPSFDTNSDGRIEMNQDDVDAIIRNKRKVRDPKACYACHRRKVKCNRELPCDSCVKRDHPELCSYERPTKRRRIALTSGVPKSESEENKSQVFQSSGPNITVPREQWERINVELKHLREQFRPPQAPQDPLVDGEDLNGSTISRSDDAEREGIHAPSNQMGTMHLGSRSVLAYMMGLGRSKSTQDAARSLLEENILPKLGLDNESVTYPFVDLWSTDNSISDINGLCSAIPDDNLCKDFYYSYRDVACTIYPVVPEPDRFEETLDLMLARRAKAERENLQLDQTKPLGISLPYLALVFAVLASGAQCSRIPAKERELTSQVYTCCSYQALRMSNFLTHPSLETIEASLIIGNVLAYNMNPGVAYIFLGMVIRMSFSIGLQMNSGSFSNHETWLRRRVWWALAWQDSHFSISYDRPTSTVLCTPDIPYARGSTQGNRSYAESMYSIIQLTQEIIRERTLNAKATMSWSAIKTYRDRVANIVADGAPHLRDRALCIKMTQHLERLALKLHSTYITSELCRPALKEQAGDGTRPNSTPVNSPPSHGRRKSSGGVNARNSPTQVDPQLPEQLRKDCLTSLEGTVEAYVELHSLSEFAARSWIGIQRAVSAAFLLGTLPECNQEPHVLQLLRDIERCIAQRTMEDPAFENMQPGSPVAQSGRRLSAGGNNVPTVESPHWARSMAKSLNGLGKLNAALNGYRTSGGVTSDFDPRLNQQQQQQQHQKQQNPMSNYPPLSGHMSAPISNMRMQYPLPSLSAIKQEGYSPGMGMMGTNALAGLGPVTPDSTGSSGDWNYGNIQERTMEYVSPALWG